MIQSVAIRLSLLYLGIIMALSIGFSVAMYNISSRQIMQSTPSTVRSGPMAGVTGAQSFDLTDFRDELLMTNQSGLKHKLIWLNIGTFVLGAAVSYLLARRTLKPIEDAFIAQGRFTADASHELRTPLTAMRTTMEVGLRNPKLSLKESKQLMQSTLEEIQKLSALANGLLKLTRYGGQDIPKGPVDISIVIEQSNQQLALAARNKNITVRQNTKRLKVLGDAMSLKEVVVILLDNAIKYSPPDTTITISSERHAKHVFVSFADQGEGIKASDIPHIFDRFYRADSSRSRDRIEGYGLGLSIAQNIAKAHGGVIEVQSTPGQGSTFTLKLPLA